MPSVGVGLRVPGGFGVRVGTRGLSIRTPIARQSIGLSGFKTTVGVPGIAHITVNPTRPSLTAGLGPARATLARTPGLSLSTRFVAVGATARPLMWARVGPIRIKVPGQMRTSTGRSWHEEVDEQWQAHYQRRPPSVSAQLCHIIREMESAPVAAASRVLIVPAPTAIPRPVLPTANVTAHRKATLKAARNEVGLFARQRRREAKAAALTEHARWAQHEQTALDAEHARLTALVSSTVAAWRAGDPASVYVVANAMLGAGGANGAVVSLVDGVATIVVFGPPLEDVHPCKPDVTPGGSATVRKRTKPQRLAVHRFLMGASAVAALNSVRHALPGVKQVDVIVVTMSSSTGSLGDSPVVATFTADYRSLPANENGFFRLIAHNALNRPKPLRAVLPDLFAGGDSDFAVATYCDSLNDLQEPDFWLEASAAAAALTAPKFPPPEVTPQQTPAVAQAPTSPDTAQSCEAPLPAPRPRFAMDPTSQLEEALTALSVIDDATTVLAHWSEVERVFSTIDAIGPKQVPSDLVADVLLTLARCARLAERTDVLHRVVLLGQQLEMPESVTRSLGSILQRTQVADHESNLRALLARAESAVRDANEDEVMVCWTQLLAGLDQVPEGADDEAEEVVYKLAVSVAVLQRRNDVEHLVSLVPRCHSAVRARFEPVVQDLVAMLDDVHRILTHVRDNPGSVQSKLGTELDIDQVRVRLLLWYLAHFSRVTRSKRGSTYLLTIDD